ncbi:hypothetical protein M011DRAFT_414469 [Sporormia fimetaria CBS 119925]|uniref:ABM domain-containing protein n=1 Tax=Sporormia fimetaria CBS 119925 TaxID=1340428 RepID=A0A6A6VPH7_9PLEO|nr:hypothetical protein M011DRAFT_414469 [Sporormia fimetaria CBS 119925]
MADDFYLFANCHFIPDKYDDWQAAYDKLAEYVWANEPTTKTYYFGIPLDYAHDFSKTTSMLAFEVYGTRDDLYKTHLSSPAMSPFLAQTPQTTICGLDLNHYRLLSGFLDLSGDKTEAGIIHQTQITCTDSAARASLVPLLKNLIAGVEKQEKENGGKSGVLTYMGFECLDDETGLRILGRWKTREDMEAFLRREDVSKFWSEARNLVRAIDQRGFVPNGKGWLHR